jgi:hypothetical protein
VRALLLVAPGNGYLVMTQGSGGEILMVCEPTLHCIKDTGRCESSTSASVTKRTTLLSPFRPSAIAFFTFAPTGPGVFTSLSGPLSHCTRGPTCDLLYPRMS